jgi:hypothetical protein
MPHSEDPSTWQFHLAVNNRSPRKIRSGEPWDPIDPKTGLRANVTSTSLLAKYNDKTAPSGIRNVKLFTVLHHDFAQGPHNPLRIGFETVDRGTEMADLVSQNGKHHVTRLRTGKREYFQVFVHD